ncbi:MAG: hypothetical protein V4755_17440 [Curtobacterium sp.]
MMQLHDDDIPGDPTPVQRFDFRKSVIGGIVVVAAGVIVLIVGIAGHRDFGVPIVAIIGGMVILASDAACVRSRRKQRGATRGGR